MGNSDFYETTAVRVHFADRAAQLIYADNFETASGSLICKRFGENVAAFTQGQWLWAERVKIDLLESSAIVPAGTVLNFLTEQDVPKDWIITGPGPYGAITAKKL